VCIERIEHLRIWDPALISFGSCQLSTFSNILLDGGSCLVVFVWGLIPFTIPLLIEHLSKPLFFAVNQALGKSRLKVKADKNQRKLGLDLIFSNVLFFLYTQDIFTSTNQHLLNWYFLLFSLFYLKTSYRLLYLLIISHIYV